MQFHDKSPLTEKLNPIMQRANPILTECRVGQTLGDFWKGAKRRENY
jgi:hypothetical protein